MIKILFSDFDGTLYVYENDGSEYMPVENYRAIKHFEDAGGHFVVTTGRAPGVFKELTSGYDLGNDFIMANGSVSVYRNGGKTIRTMSAQMVAELLDMVMEDENNYFCIYRDDDSEDVYSKSEHEDYLRRILESEGHILNVTINCHAPEKLDEMGKRIKERYGAEITFSPPLPFLADITAGGVDKGSAIREFCEHYGIDYEETAGIGDGRNDKAIFEAVKLKFAVNNGHPELKALADYCVDSVAEAIEMIMENNRE